MGSEVQPVGKMDDSDDHDISDLLADTYCAVAGDKTSSDTILFIKVKDSYCAQEQMTNDYNNIIAPGMDHIEGKFIEKVHIEPKGNKKVVNKEDILLQGISSIPHPLYNPLEQRMDFFS